MRHTGELDSVKKVPTGCRTERKKLNLKMFSGRAVTKGCGQGISIVTIMEMNPQPVFLATGIAFYDIWTWAWAEIKILRVFG